MMTQKEFVKRWKALDLKYIDDIMKESKKLVLKRFDLEQNVDGKTQFNNAPLRPSTIRERGSSGPILKRSGKLRDSIKFTNNGKGGIGVSSSIDYAENLHQGKHSGFWGRNADGSPKKIKAKMKPRKFLAFPKEFKKRSGEGRQMLLNKLEAERNQLMRIYTESKLKL